jgi:hypothetical protein
VNQPALFGFNRDVVNTVPLYSLSPRKMNGRGRDDHARCYWEIFKRRSRERQHGSQICSCHLPSLRYPPSPFSLGFLI